MVMHARKLPRFNDGYYEKHQQGHSSYQNSKYSSSKGSSYPDRHNQERSDRSRSSPNGNTSRSNTPERDHSPRNRSFSNKAWYSQQAREKERERDRTYRNEQGRDRNDQGRDRNEPTRDRSNNKDKYYSSDHTRSPKDRRPVNRDSGYPTNHDRNNSDKPSAVNKGSGQLYSSSKDPLRKPAHGNVRDKRDERERTLKVGDWSEHTSSSGKKYYYNCKTEVSQWEKPREWLEKEGLSHLLRPPGSSSRSAQDKHSVSRSNSVVNNYRDHSKYTHSKDRDNASNWNNRENSASSAYKDDHYNDHRVQESSSITSSAMVGEGQPQDMEISSEGSTPTSEHYPTTLPPQQHHSLIDAHVPSSSSTITGSLVSLSSTVNKSLQPGIIRSEMKLEPATSSFNSSLTNASAISTSCLSNPIPTTSENNVIANQMKIDSNTTCDTGGPPTPTHSEAQDDLEQKSGASPETTPTPAVSALQGISSLQGFYPMQLPQLTPGLSQYVKDDLTEHVRGWPAEACERQAHKLATEAHLVTSMRITDISIALKSARSRVRLNEIQSTLLEQRVMLYRHEVKSLENMKTPSLFTSDDNN